MSRYLISFLLGVLPGIGIGFLIGNVLVPATVVEGSIPALETSYQEAYTLMVAHGYENDQDADGALDRLSVLGVSNIPLYIQELTERYINTSQHISNVELLVGLSEGLGRLSPIMEPFRNLTSARSTP